MRRPAFAACVAVLPSIALANAAMPLAYQIFDYRLWAVYVVATVVLEAWIIGVRAELTWSKAILGSLIANGISAALCQTLLGPVHSMNMDPNPLQWTMQVLAYSGIASTLLEALVWSFYAFRVPGKWSLPRIVLRSLVAHGIGIPTALLIFLIPPHPYPGLDATANGARERCIAASLRRQFLDEAEQLGKLPKIQSIAELEVRFPCSSTWGAQEERWTAAYWAQYGRFDTHERGQSPSRLEWNAAASGTALSESSSTSSSKLWLVRRRSDEGLAFGYVFDLAQHKVVFSNDPHELGW